MINEDKEIDDVPAEKTPLDIDLNDHEALAAMNTDELLSLKNDIQQFLIEARETENPAFVPNEAFVEWAHKSGKIFELFFNEMCRNSPGELLQLHKEIKNEKWDHTGPFIQKWGIFLDHAAFDKKKSD